MWPQTQAKNVVLDHFARFADCYDSKPVNTTVCTTAFTCS